MSDAFDARAELEFSLKGARETLNDLQDLEEGLIDIGLAQERAEKRFKETEKAARSSGKAFKESGDAVRSTKSAIAEADKATGSFATGSLPRLRYALYDVASTARVTSLAITGVGIASVAAYASMESSFTSVERTLDGVSAGGVIRLRDELTGLTREIPRTFANISEIATLGNQLGIASSDIAQFTATTAKFSTVTGLTAEASAQAFGSLGELLNVQARDYEALGSSIALVGRKSVATEAEIVAMTTRLAASATNAGFTAQQVIALSGAFASLRIAPERAQGVMEVYFNRLNTAIAEGGPKLEAFARVAGVATDQVEGLVRSDPTAFFERLANGLGQMDQIAQTSALKDLGLQGIRAGEVFGRVSANVEVFNAALADANQGWSEGTELADQYAKVVDDLASRWQIFLNAVMEAGAGLGRTLAPALGVVLELLTTMLQGFAAIANDPVGQWFVGTAAFIGILIAGITGLIAVSALGVASMAAMRSAIVDLNITAGAGTFGLRALSTATTQVGTAMGFSAGAIRTFKVALASTGVGLAVVALGALAAGLWDAASASKGLSAELQPVADSLARAIDADTAIYAATGRAVTTYTAQVKETASATDVAASAAQQYAGSQVGLASSATEATTRITEQTRALGENVEALIRNRLAQDEGFTRIANDPQIRASAEAAGFSVGEMVAAGMRHSGGFTGYLAELEAKARELDAKAEAAYSGGNTDLAQQYWDQSAALGEVTGQLQQYASDMDRVRNETELAGVAAEYAGASAEGAASGLEGMASAADSAYSSLSDVQQAALGTENRMFALGSAIGENAGAWDIFSEGGRQSLGALYSVLDAIAAETPGDTMAIAANFQALYNTLIAGGYATEQQLAVVSARVKELTGGAAVLPAVRNFSSLFSGIASGAQKAAKAVGGGGGGLRKEIKTLVDYANDLQGVFKRAFDLRFGNQQGFDQITSGWRKIADAANAAREAIEEHQRKLADLAADKSIKEYWLMVAENYGDELRAAKLRAELADVSADMAKEQKALAKAQDKASMSLVGNSDAAIENRSEILGLVSNYQSYLQSLAASGMSQAALQQKSAQLRAEFLQQAVSMGYNRAEVEKYARAFDDMSTIIAKVPRKITVTFSGDVALQAINEFAAKANKALGGVSSSIGATFDDSGLKKAARGANLQAQILGLQAKVAISGGTDVASIVRIAQIAAQLNSGNYWTGGYVGDGGKYEPKGVVHGGEFVFSKAATRAIGVNNLAYMHNMAKSGKSMAPVGLGAASGMVELAPYDRMLLQTIADRVGLSIESPTIQALTNGANANAAMRRSA
ncbi:phage tail tape measure protein [Streptomyces sp. AC495_CC817]|uniref:phage tail tape measure protein n=1 Tax=Streptomyces sp. AC495_CC817 TaxID=2823900 RepID=UPI001C25721A|nr:phage tail tape measure protein [Streptomyces sp. AC495_CC817]